MSNHIEAGRLRVRVAVFACVAVAALAIDQITKALALAHLRETQSVRVIPGLLSLRLVHNPGASLGMGAGATWLISLFAMAASVVLLVMGVRTVSTRWSALLGLAFAGAVGNLIDRIAYADGFLNGKVVDFLDYGWSIGNVADIFLMAAGIGIVVLIFLGVPFSQKELDEHNARIAAGASAVSGASGVSGVSDVSDAEEPAAR